MKQIRIKRKTHKRRPDETPPPSAKAEVASKTKHDLDDLLAEVDGVLEENAEKGRE